MSFLALCPQAGTYSEPRVGIDQETSSGEKTAGTQVLFQGTQKFLREVSSENFHPHIGLPLKKPYDKMSELRSRKIRGLYTLYRKIFFNLAILKNKTKRQNCFLQFPSLDLQCIYKLLGAHLQSKAGKSRSWAFCLTTEWVSATLQTQHHPHLLDSFFFFPRKAVWRVHGWYVWKQRMVIIY